MKKQKLTLKEELSAIKIMMGKLIYEQPDNFDMMLKKGVDKSTQRNQVAKQLYDLMKGVDFKLTPGTTTPKEKQILSIINGIKTKDDWDALQRQFGWLGRGAKYQDLVTWLKDDLSPADYENTMKSLALRLGVSSIQPSTQKYKFDIEGIQ